MLVRVQRKENKYKKGGYVMHAGGAHGLKWEWQKSKLFS